MQTLTNICDTLSSHSDISRNSSSYSNSSSNRNTSRNISRNTISRNSNSSNNYHQPRLKMTKGVFLGLVIVAFLHPSVGALNIVTGQQVPACQPFPLLGYQNPVCDCQNSASQGSAVSCASRDPKLNRVPSGLPEDLQVLNLNDNNIGIIYKRDLEKVENVRTIFLQNNVISLIESGAFNNLYHLQLLVLSGNRLTMIVSDYFQHLPSLLNLDLSNNRIVRVDRKAFFTLPATHRASVTVQLSGNQIFCDCEARALRDWARSLSSPLAPFQFNGFQCQNAAGVELNSMRDQDFACAGVVPSMFEARQQCVSCRNGQTQLSCDDTRRAVCGAPQPVCLTEVKMTSGKLSVYKSCSSYSDCLLRSRNNYRLCNVSHAFGAPDAMDCSFCCTGPDCNKEDMGGRTSSFTLYIGIQLQRAFQSYMLQPQDSRYIQKTNIYVQKLNELFQTTEGGYVTRFHSFKNLTGQVYVTCLVHVSLLSIYSVEEAARLMLNVLNNTLHQETSFFRQEGAQSFYVGTELSTTKICPAEQTQMTQGAITWQETPVGITRSAFCPSNAPSDMAKYVTRSCVLDNRGLARWTVPDISSCQKSDITTGLEELNNTDINPNSVNNVLTRLEKLTSDGPQMSPADVTTTVGIVERAMAQGEALKSASGTNNTLQVLSNVLNAQDPVLVQADMSSRSATRLLAAADKIGSEGKLGADGQMLVTAPNIAVAALAVSDSDSFKGATLTAQTAIDQAFDPGDIQIQAKSTTPTQEVSSLVLPPSLLTASGSGNRIAMKALVSDKIFQVIKQSKDRAVSDRQNNVRQINSHVLDATVVGRDVRNLPDPVTMTFVHLNESSTNPACVFWDVSSVKWSSEGCTLDTDLSTNTTTFCRCNHLTNFALLMDVYGEGASLSETDKRILSIISYIGCGVSLLALLLTLLTYILFKKLRRDNPSKILVNLCIALALSNLIFVAGMQPYALDNLIGCKIVAVLLHFSLLSALSWMAVEAFYMYLALVLVFKTYFTNFLLKCSLIGWGVPLLIVAITLGVNETDNYGPLDSGVCWIKGLAFYIAFVAPVGLILIINFMAFGLVLRQILGLAERKLNKSDSFSVAQQLRGAVGVAILLGLTWIFALFAIDRASVVFYYLFAIFNSLQGLWIFVFYCVLKKEARNSWRRALPCCPTFDDKSGISNTRGGYSGTAMRTERSKSSTDNGLTTTTTAFTSSSADSEGTYVNLQTNHQEKPKAVESNQIQIKLNNSAAPNQSAGDDTQPPSNQPTRTVHRSEGNITLPAIAPTKGTQHAPQVITINHSPVPEVTTKPSSAQTGGSQGDAQSSPPPLHFKVGYTLSNTSTNSADLSHADAPNNNNSSNDNQPSVAELIKKMNNTRL